MKVKIVEATIDDASNFFNRENECFRYKVRFDKELLHSRLRSLVAYGVSYKAVYKGVIIGHLTSFITRHGDIFIDYLCVDPIYHGKQVGTQLLSKLLSDHPRKSIKLYTDQPNKGAMIFYIRKGFTIDNVKGTRVDFVRYN